MQTNEKLKADLFNQISSHHQSITIYCQDHMTKFILEELLSKNILELFDISLPKYKIHPTYLGCNNLEMLPKYENHFKKVVIVLDGYSNTEKTNLFKKPLNEESKIENNISKLHENCIMLPTSLPTELYLYYILHQLIYHHEYNSFWDNLRNIPEEKGYTKSNLIKKFINQFDNTDNLSNVRINRENIISQLKAFFIHSKALRYYYSQPQNKAEIVEFIAKCKKVFELVNAE
ncbi:hypothetical protein HZ320_06690 [[Pasteurella] aerogenes]|nr:hypothetical protein HZ320_06690 [[Pasteurella] aerogenes]